MTDEKLVEVVARETRQHTFGTHTREEHDDLVRAAILAYEAAKGGGEAVAGEFGGPPNGYHPLPEGMRCKCIKAWQDGKGNFWCCQPIALAPAETQKAGDAP